MPPILLFELLQPQGTTNPSLSVSTYEQVVLQEIATPSLQELDRGIAERFVPAFPRTMTHISDSGNDDDDDDDDGLATHRVYPYVFLEGEAIAAVSGAVGRGLNDGTTLQHS
ncbi:MAG: hypothetical protein AB4042_07975, partial [Leptolyngbyaceae cyanobacterium]